MFDTEQEPPSPEPQDPTNELEPEPEPEAALAQTDRTLASEETEEAEQTQTIQTEYKDIALDDFIAPDKTSDSLSAIIIGNAEGTRTPKGGMTRHYGQHIDPGNSVLNRGSYSLQGASKLSPREADRVQQQRMQSRLPAYTAACKAAGIAPTNAVALTNYFDMYNIKPALASSFGAMFGDLAGKGLTIEAAIDVRVAASQKTQPRARWSGWEKIARDRLNKPSAQISDAEFWRVVRNVHAHRVHAMRDAMVALGMRQRGTTQRTKPEDRKPTKTDPTETRKPGTTDGDGGNVNVTVGEMRPLKPGHIISDSVGKGGANHAPDVGVVQQALAAHGHSPGPHDMKIGPLTIGAIVELQRGFLRKPDGLVEVGRQTEKHLMQSPASMSSTTEPRETSEAEPTEEETPEDKAPDTRTTQTSETEDGRTETPVSDGSLRELMARPRLTTAEIARARAMIAKEPKEQRPQLYRDLQGKVVYANQLDNETVEGGKRIGYKMCNLTSLAMCLQYLGIPNPHPQVQYEDALEKVRLAKGFKPRTWMEGWGAVARALGAQVIHLAGDGKFDRAWWQKKVGGALSSGQAVMLSLGGPKSHIVRVQAVTDGGLLVDDPNGQAKLNAGIGHVWQARNKPTAEGKAGEDFTWPWAQVEPHIFHWVAAIGR